MITLKVTNKGKVIMTTKYNINDFFIKVENEGGFADMAIYGGYVEVEGHPELTNAFNEFVDYLDILEDHYNVWNEAEVEGDE